MMAVKYDSTKYNNMYILTGLEHCKQSTYKSSHYSVTQTYTMH